MHLCSVPFRVTVPLTSDLVLEQSCPEHSKKEGKDQESIQSITLLDPGYQREGNKFTIRHHK